MLNKLSVKLLPFKKFPILQFERLWKVCLLMNAISNSQVITSLSYFEKISIDALKFTIHFALV